MGEDTETAKLTSRYHEKYYLSALSLFFFIIIIFGPEEFFNMTAWVHTAAAQEHQSQEFN